MLIIFLLSFTLLALAGNSYKKGINVLGTYGITLNVIIINFKILDNFFPKNIPRNIN